MNQFIIKFILLYIWLFTLYLSFPNIRHIVIILSLFRISTTLSHSSSLTNIPTPIFTVWFPDHHNLYLFSSTAIKQAFWSLYHTSCRSKICIFFFLNSFNSSFHYHKDTDVSVFKSNANLSLFCF